MRIKRLLASLTIVGLASCGDSTSPTIGVSGSLSFSYTGAGAASSTNYSANGAVPANMATSFGASSWAAGSTSTAGETDVGASVPRTSTSWDLTSLTIARTTVGSATISSSCISNCTEVSFILGANQSQSSFTFLCDLTTGTVAITSISSTQVSGTFSGSGTCFANAGGGSSAFTITNGTFNVGLTTLVF